VRSPPPLGVEGSSTSDHCQVLDNPSVVVLKTGDWMRKCLFSIAMTTDMFAAFFVTVSAATGGAIEVIIGGATQLPVLAQWCR
jgi:hypothetical protein